jgi:protein O-mannosyl-transferase
MIAALAFAAHRYPSLRLPLAWAAIAILPVSNLVVRIGVLMAERLLYLPSVAIALVLAQLYDSLHRRARPLVANAALAALAIAFAGLTLARNADWQTPLALWRDTVDKQPRSALAHANLAASCLTVGDTTCAKQELRRAVALDPLRADFRALLDELR